MAICPLMSYATQKVDCVQDCALWRPYDGSGGQCGLLSVGDRVSEGLNELNSNVRDIKVKL